MATVRWKTDRIFDPRDMAGLPPLNEIKEAWDTPLPHEDPGMDEERRLLSVAQYVRDYCLPQSVEEVLHE